jgi:predicted GNAT superfamily acetyltransferase
MVRTTVAGTAASPPPHRPTTAARRPRAGPPRSRRGAGTDAATAGAPQVQYVPRKSTKAPRVPPSASDDAAALAAEAAARARARVVDLHQLEHLRAASRLFDEVWGREGSAGAVLAPEALTALAHAGGQVTGAFRGDELVGATAAFVGILPDGQARLHSHVTGVAARATGTGVGRALKLHQRAWCLRRGIAHVRWTFDPLVRRNAVFNLVTLGARAVSFEHDVYGPMADARNAGLPTDRLVADWELQGPRVRAALAGRAAQPDVGAVRRAGAEPVLRVGDDDRPIVTPSDAPRRLVQVPADIEAIRREDPELARGWAQAVRDGLGGALDAGFRVTGLTRDGWYLLAADNRTEELADQR